MDKISTKYKRIIKKIEALSPEWLDEIDKYIQFIIYQSATNTPHSFIGRNSTNDIPVEKGNKNLDPLALFGLWEKKPRYLRDIRQNYRLDTDFIAILF